MFNYDDLMMIMIRMIWFDIDLTDCYIGLSRALQKAIFKRMENANLRAVFNERNTKKHRIFTTPISNASMSISNTSLSAIRSRKTNLSTLPKEKMFKLGSIEENFKKRKWREKKQRKKNFTSFKARENDASGSME